MWLRGGLKKIEDIIKVNNKEYKKVIKIVKKNFILISKKKFINRK